MSTSAGNRFPSDSAAKTLEYAIVDVFAERPLEGNSLAVFPEVHGLRTAQMQAIARELNLSETTFIFSGDPVEDAANGIRVRIFTTTEELPFAGHPTLGTASWLHLNHPTLRGSETITLRLNAGDVPVSFGPSGDARAGVFATMTQADPAFAAVLDSAEVAQVLGVPAEAIDPRLPVQIVSTGMAFCLVPFRSVEALSKLAIPLATAQPWLDRAGGKFFYCLAPSEPSSASDFTARMQFYGGEDPATGSAAGCAIAWLVRHGAVVSGREIVIEQGSAILRPSRLHADATLLDDKVIRVHVGGRTIPVASGWFFRP